MSGDRAIEQAAEAMAGRDWPIEKHHEDCVTCLDARARQIAQARAAVVAFLRHVQASEEALDAFLREADSDVDEVESTWLEAAFRAEADRLERAATQERADG